MGVPVDVRVAARSVHADYSHHHSTCGDDRGLLQPELGITGDCHRTGIQDFDAADMETILAFERELCGGWFRRVLSRRRHAIRRVYRRGRCRATRICTAPYASEHDRALERCGTTCPTGRQAVPVHNRSIGDRDRSKGWSDFRPHSSRAAVGSRARQSASNLRRHDDQGYQRGSVATRYWQARRT